MNNIDLSKLKTSKKASSLEERKSVFDFLQKDIKFFSSQLGDKKKERFYSELAVLFSAGVDIKTAFEIIEEQQEKDSDRGLYKTIKNSVMGGKGLSEAMEETGKFSPYEIFSIRIGEESGRLAEVLNDVTFFYGQKIKQKRQLVSAMSYPLTVLTVAFGVIFFMMKFIVPMFADMLKRNGSDLPYITKVVVRASYFVSHFGLVAIFLVSVVVFAIYTQRNAEWFRKIGSAILFRIPFFGNLITKIYIARFCQSMNLLLSAKTPIVNALGLVTKMVGFYPLEKSLPDIREDIMKGKPFHACLSGFRVYPTRMISLVKVAEEVNKLDVIFGKLAKQYSEEAEYETNMMSKVVEPILMIFLGIFVALILVAMYIPMLQMTTSVG